MLLILDLEFFIVVQKKIFEETDLSNQEPTTISELPRP